MDEVVSSMWKAAQDEGNKATQYVEDLAKKSGVPVERKFVEGHPAEEILKIAEKSKFLLGSIADKVVRHTKVPVLVIPEE